jgi:hypothetical protein
VGVSRSLKCLQCVPENTVEYKKLKWSDGGSVWISFASIVTSFLNGQQCECVHTKRKVVASNLRSD